MEDYVQKFQNIVNQINADSQHVLIVNAGSMNHGKSSLFNAILDREEFAAADFRTTAKSSQSQWFDDVYLMDTPGLNANDSDDLEAQEAYRRANLIVFVHTIKIGELHRSELDAINAIKGLFSDEKYFWNHFCAVFTNLDAENNESATQIVDKALTDIQTTCNGSGFQTFLVSNTRYKTGQAKGKEKLVEASNIPAFRAWLQKNLPRWRAENGIIRRLKINREKKSISDQLFEMSTTIQNRKEQKSDEYVERSNDYLERLQEVFDDIDSQWKDSSSRRKRIDELDEDITKLQERLKRERARF